MSRAPSPRVPRPYVTADVIRYSECRLLTAYGTLYRALGRLEDMGLLKSRREDPEVAARENRPGRRFYTLTAAGEDASIVRVEGFADGSLTSS